jgi:hypothetical protein
MFRFTKKRAAVVGLVASLSVGAAAFAYFTTTGAGFATGAVGNGTALSLQGEAPGILYPGGSSVVNFTVDNPSNGSQRVGTIHLAKVTTENVSPGCIAGDLGDFAMDDVVANQIIVGNASRVSIVATGTIRFNDTAANQDACKGAALLLHLTSTSS